MARVGMPSVLTSQASLGTRPAPPDAGQGPASRDSEGKGGMRERGSPKAPLTRFSFIVPSIGSLQKRLARVGAADTRFIIVNERSSLSQALHGELELHAPSGVPVYGQQGPGPDIWSILGGAKDDFLVYDRCGRLTFHLQLPFSFLHFPYVESAVRFTHRQDHCGNCSFYSTQVNGTDPGKAEPSTQAPSLGKEGQEPLVEGPSTPRLTLLSSTAHSRDPLHSHNETLPFPDLSLPRLEKPHNEGTTQ